MNIIEFTGRILDSQTARNAAYLSKSLELHFAARGTGQYFLSMVLLERVYLVLASIVTCSTRPFSTLALGHTTSNSTQVALGAAVLSTT
jgi:hypothetical protein